MTALLERPTRTEDDGVAAALRTADAWAFAGRLEGYRRELKLHCAHMLGSVDEADELVHETFLRAWRQRERYEDGSPFSAWLSGIATNACLDFLDRSTTPM